MHMHASAPRVAIDRPSAAQAGGAGSGAAADVYGDLYAPPPPPLPPPPPAADDKLRICVYSLKGGKKGELLANVYVSKPLIVANVTLSIAGSDAITAAAGRVSFSCKTWQIEVGKQYVMLDDVSLRDAITALKPGASLIICMPPVEPAGGAGAGGGRGGPKPGAAAAAARGGEGLDRTNLLAQLVARSGGAGPFQAPAAPAASASGGLQPAGVVAAAAAAAAAAGSRSSTVAAPRGLPPPTGGAAPSGAVHRKDLLDMLQALTLRVDALQDLAPRVEELETEVSKLKAAIVGSDSGSDSDSGGEDGGEDGVARRSGLVAPLTTG